jgi:hypothetical protein
MANAAAAVIRPREEPGAEQYPDIHPDNLRPCGGCEYCDNLLQSTAGVMAKDEETKDGEELGKLLMPKMRKQFTGGGLGSGIPMPGSPPQELPRGVCGTDSSSSSD